MQIDLGDVYAEINLRIKNAPRKPRSVFKLGAQRSTVPADRVPSVPQPYSPKNGKVDLLMQLPSDKKFALGGMVDVDEMGNEIGPSADQPTSYTTDDVEGMFIVLTDNGDGTGEVAATGVLGVAQVTAHFADGTEEVLAVNTVVGEPSGRMFKVGPLEEVTPD